VPFFPFHLPVSQCALLCTMFQDKKAWLSSLHGWLPNNKMTRGVTLNTLQTCLSYLSAKRGDSIVFLRHSN
jgi:hypothetical protein